MYSHPTITTNASSSNKGAATLQLTAAAACTKCDTMAVREETAKWMRKRAGESSLVRYNLHLVFYHISIFTSYKAQRAN